MGKKISGEGAVRSGMGFNSFILNEDIDYIIRIVKSLVSSTLLIGGATDLPNLII